MNELIVKLLHKKEQASMDDDTGEDDSAILI